MLMIIVNITSLIFRYNNFYLIHYIVVSYEVECFSKC